MNSRTDMRRIAWRTTGNAAVVIGMGFGLAWLLAPLGSSTETATTSPAHPVDASTPMLLAAFVLTGIGFALLRWSRRR